jgi:hypothetical protein
MERRREKVPDAVVIELENVAGIVFSREVGIYYETGPKDGGKDTSNSSHLKIII